jgi:hypothetical protein
VIMYGFRLVSDPRPKQSSGDWEMQKWTALLAVLVCFCVVFCWSSFVRLCVVLVWFQLVSLRVCVPCGFGLVSASLPAFVWFCVVLGWSRLVPLRLRGSVWFCVLSAGLAVFMRGCFNHA